MELYKSFFGYRDFLKEEEVKQQISKSKYYTQSEDIKTAKAMNFFSTSIQKSWLIMTPRRLYCVLDDIKQPEASISWSIPNSKVVDDSGKVILEIKVNDAYKENTGLIDFGSSRRSWLYSKSLFNNDGETLKSRIEELAWRR